MDKKQQIVNLWRTCFGDSEAFISLYFDRVYKDENAMTIEKDGKIVSALQIVPHTMTYLGTEISVGLYLWGVHDSGRKRVKGLCDNSCKRHSRKWNGVRSLSPP